jgi:hypothetical protein
MGQARRESSHQMLHPSLRHLLADHLTAVVASEANAETFASPQASGAIHDTFASSHQRCSLETPCQTHL